MISSPGAPDANHMARFLEPLYDKPMGNASLGSSKGPHQLSALFAAVLIVVAFGFVDAQEAPTPAPTATPVAIPKTTDDDPGLAQPEVNAGEQRQGVPPSTPPAPAEDGDGGGQLPADGTTEPGSTDEDSAPAGSPAPTTAEEEAAKAAAQAEATAKAAAEEQALEEQKHAQLNPYPEQAKMKASEKWNLFKDATRGLLMWDFFDGRVTLRAHARLQVDGTVANANEQLESAGHSLENSFDLRRFSLFAQGTIDHHFRYSVAFDFGADAGLGEVFVEGIDQGLSIFGYNVGQFRLGTFQEPFSFERVTSSYYVGFLERSLPVWTFTPGNNLGYMVHDTAHNGRMQWALGFFSWGQEDEANASNSVLSVTSRVTGLPIYRDDGRRLLHIGASVSFRNPGGGDTRYRSRPEARFVDFLVDTGEIDAGDIRLYGIEVVGVHGPLSWQAEMISSQVTGTPTGDLMFWGSYAQVGYFLTGDHRHYDKELGVFSRLVPKHESDGLRPFKNGGLGGAFEVVGRISNVDLDDGSITGGQMTNISVGLNWYLKQTSVVKLNYIHSDVKDRGTADILLLRYQFRPLPVPGWR